MSAFSHMPIDWSRKLNLSSTLVQRSSRITNPDIVLDTPLLVVDDDILQRNIDEMAGIAKDRGIALRPHIKTHKTPEVARRQIEAGAVGIMCAKLGEAEVFADAGIMDIAIGYQIVGEPKLRRLVDLMRTCHLIVALDNEAAANRLSQAVSAHDQQLDIYLEIDTGHHRSGVLAGEPAVALAKQVANLPGLHVIGVMTHEGQANASPPEEIEAKAMDAGRSLVNTAELIRAAGVPIAVVSVGSTPCADLTTSVNGVTEMRPGTYVFRDVAGFRYGRFGPDRCAARYVSSVANRPSRDRAVIDAGAKTLALDLSASLSGHGFVVGHPDVLIDRLSEEHGVLTLPVDEPGFAIGDQIEIIPNHVCPSVNLHDVMHIVKNGQIVAEWRIAARGKVT